MCYDCCVVVWRESVVIGETSMGAQEVQEVVQQLGSEYKGTAYHLLERNCNHFSNELCLKLTGKPAPLWVILLVPESPFPIRSAIAAAVRVKHGEPGMTYIELATPKEGFIHGPAGEPLGWHGYHAALPPAYIVGAAVESSNCPASPRYVKHC